MKPTMVAWALVLSVLLAGVAAAAPAQPGVAFGWQGSTGWLPLELRSDHHVYLKVMANGHEAVAMLDPNLANTAVDAAFAQTIGLKDGDALALGFPRLAISGLSPTLKDLSPLQPALRHPVAVIIGADAMSQVITDIDLPGHRISLDDLAGYTFPDIARFTPLEHDGDAWLAPVSIEGHRSALFALDFINSDHVQLAPDYARSLSLEPVAAEMLVSYDGAVPNGRVLLDQMKFVGVVSTGVVADVPQRLRPAYGAAQGALGVGTLRNYRLILDLRHARLYSLLVDQSGSDLNIFTMMRPPTPGNATGSILPKPSGGF